MVEARAESLLYDEETFDFVAANYGIIPKSALLYALSYLIKLLNIVLRAKENMPKYKEYGRAIKKVKERYGFTPDQFYNEEPRLIIDKFEKDCNKKS